MVAPRIVSLVPSWTETVFAFGAGDRLIGRTEWCVEPAGEVERVATYGGTKNPDVTRILVLGPDLVIVNCEENTRRDVEALEAAGGNVRVLRTFARSAREALGEMQVLGEALGGGSRAEAVTGACAQAVEVLADASAARAGPTPRVFCPIWRDPWMTINAQTYVSDVLALCGLKNVFDDRRRRYPLAADSGRGAARPVPDGDTRYPRIGEDEIARSGADFVLLPSEPYAFGEKDAEDLRRLLPEARVSLIDGKDLSWYGARMATGLPRLHRQIEDGLGRRAPARPT